MHLRDRRRPRPIGPAVWRRFQVSQAHELRRRLRTVPRIVALLFIVSGISLMARYPGDATGILVVNVIGAAALFSLGPLAGIASPRGVLFLSFLMPCLTGLTMAGTIAVEPAAFATAMASLAIIPIGAPLLLAWDAPTARRLIVGYGLGIGLLTLVTGLGSLTIGQRIDVASLVGCCCVVGILAANLLQGLRLQSIEKEVELHRLNRVLHGYATTDPLTRLRNRRQLEGDVALIWPSIQRGASCAVVMLDLDHFKRLNDERGHAAGDSTLRLVAMELQRQVRGRDSVYRVGGEEFLVLLRDTTLDGGLQVADRIREAIADLGLPGGGGTHPARLTISGGVAVADEHATSWDSVVAWADAAMYAAKEAGRDRVFGPYGQVAAAA
jgi:diguanylate cyclase (GGDEF)-like protein